MFNKFTWLLIFIVIPLMNFNIIQVGATAGDSQSTAINLPLNTTILGTLSISSSIWYNITIVSSGDYSFNLNVTYPYNSFNIYLYDHLGVEIGFMNTSYYYPKIIALHLDPEIYSLQIIAYSGSGGYAVRATNAKQGQTLDNPNFLSMNTTIEGQAPYSAYYQISISIQGYYKFNLSSDPSTTYHYNLLDNNGNILKSSSSYIYPLNLPINLTVGNYYLQIIFIYGTLPFYICVVPYSIHPGEDLANAIQLPINTTISGIIPTTEFFNLSISKSGYYNFVLESKLTSSYPIFYSVNVFNLNGKYIGGVFNNYYPSHLPLNLTIGYYYLDIVFTANLGFFNVTYSNYIPHPGEDLSLAVFLPINTSLEGSTDYSLFYNFTITSTGIYKFSTNNGSNYYLSFAIYQDYNYIAFSNNNPPSIVVNLKPGNYYIHIQPSTLSENFTISYNSYNPKPGETIISAINLPIDNCLAGQLPTQRFFNVTIQNSDQYYFQLIGVSYAYVSFAIYNSTGVILTSTGVGQTTSKILNLNAGTYTIIIYGDPGTSFILSYQTKSNYINNSLNCFATISSSSSSSSQFVTSTASQSRTSSFISIPFSPFEIILVSLVILALFGSIRRKQKKPLK